MTCECQDKVHRDHFQERLRTQPILVLNQEYKLLKGHIGRREEIYCKRRKWLTKFLITPKTTKERYQKEEAPQAQNQSMTKQGSKQGTKQAKDL